MSLRQLSIASLLLFTISLQASPPPLQIGENGRYLVEPDGSAFIWIGDTAWELFHKLDREQALHYLDDRAAKGFTVVQAVVLAELNGLRVPNAYGDLPLHDLDPTRPNEAYFQHVDFIVDEAEKRGLYIGMLPTWGDKVPSSNPGAGPIVFNPENASRFGAFLGDRYKSDPIIWILGGDREVMNQNVKKTWDAMGRSLKASSEGKQLLTYHPRGNETSATWFSDSDWLDFHMYQIGHEPRTANLHRLLGKSRQSQPVKPVVDGEPAYEDIPVRFWNYLDFSTPTRAPEHVLDENGYIVKPEYFRDGFITPHDVRIHAYWDFLGGAAGHTYGHNAVWQMYRPGDPIALPTLRDWRSALDRPAAAQMIHLRSLWEKRPLEKLVPGGDFIASSPPKHSIWAHSDDDSYALVYLPDGGAVAIDTSALAMPSFTASWYNPSTGQSAAIGSFTQSQSPTFTAPATSAYPDWLLVLDSSRADYPDL
ncbi:DUF4038 domain-containing protein [Pelagicoccus sp. SDUM812003]|uniref:apiosidase-like domain-containing protein n=1 Tax=Pelagicoccus sp. SDUM812003 TaxID=3041267 RepID=UPI0028101844|nr:DUF4038 domain-containing protein [Pelagicoccus sp. SDUM812003]MDQ8203384.1 DUF4038 domain-containing protein [Pelagicoccus sp. SDUM812003]